ncbi:MAG TPA: hypothetical protein VGZ73_03390 [Bryobacteraceae bacterium]|jgi:hypothetical protein|nr:hypothetical protein [Bryobacteraceae bacterium]
MNFSSLFNRFGVDPQGNILIAANTSSCTLPTVNPLYPCGPIWIGKLDASGQKLLFATYLGNGATTAYTAVAGIAADSNGNLIVAAHTVVPDLPTANAFQSAPKSPFTSLYLAKLSADGSQLLYATYLGGSGAQSALSLAVDGADAAYLAAWTTSTDFPTTPQSAHDASAVSTVVAKLSPDGTLQYAATFPFEFYTVVKPIQLDVTGSAVLVSNAQVLRVAPDGASLTRTPLPPWALPATTCTTDSGGSAVCPGTPWALPRATGGFQFAGTAASGVPVTTDALQRYDDSNGYVRIEGGQAVHSQFMAPVSGFAVDPQDHNRIYAATPKGLFLSGDNGQTWSLLRDGASLAIAVDPFDSNRLYLSVAANPPLYRSTDGGAGWTAISSGLPGSARITSIAADPNVPGLLYGAGGPMFRSTDGGDTWDSRSVGPSEPNMSPSASTSTSSVSVQVDPTHAGWAYVVGITSCIGFCPVTQNLARTQDGGNRWTDAPPPPNPPASFLSTTGLVAVDPNTGDVVEAVKSGAPAGNRLLLYRNGDFTAPQVLFSGEATSIAFDPEHPGTIYLAVHIAQGIGSGYFVVESVDDGATWTNVLQLDRPVNGLTVGAGGILHASQNPGLPEGYFLVTDALGNVQYGTYLGGAFTQVNWVAASGGRVFVAGKTQGGLPLVNSAQPALGGGTDGFVAVFDDGGALIWSTYLGGSADDSIDWVLPLPDGSAVVVGTTNSADFPSLAPSPLGTGNTFIAHLRP